MEHSMASPTDAGPAGLPSEHALLSDIEAALIAFDGLFVAIFELSSATGPAGRRLEAVAAVSAYLIDELERAREAVRGLYTHYGARRG